MKLPRWLDLGRYLREHARRAEVWPLDPDGWYRVSDGTEAYRIQGQDHAVRLSWMLNTGARYSFRAEPHNNGWWKVTSEWEEYLVIGEKRAEQMAKRLNEGGGNFLVERAGDE